MQLSGHEHPAGNCAVAPAINTIPTANLRKFIIILSAAEDASKKNNACTTHAERTKDYCARRMRMIYFYVNIKLLQMCYGPDQSCITGLAHWII